MLIRLRLVVLLAALAMLASACATAPGSAIRKADPAFPLQAFYAAEGEYTIALRTFVAVADPIAYRPEVDRVIDEVAMFDMRHARPVIVAVNEAVTLARDEDGQISEEYVRFVVSNLSGLMPEDSPQRGTLEALLAAIEARRMPDGTTFDAVNAFLATAEAYVRARLARVEGVQS